MKSKFEIRSVSKRYNGEMVLLDISLSIKEGQSLAIIGPSGSGKSTLLRLLAGLEEPTHGEILLGGSLVSKQNQIILPPHQRGISMVFQDLALWSNLSILDNVILGLAARPLSKQEKRKKAFEALSLCKIEALADRKPGSISGGQQQRVALSRALATEPVFLFLDEPFSGLDLVLKATLLEEISLLTKKKNITVVLVSHDPMEAFSLCGSAIVLDQGRIEEAGSFKDLLRSPKSHILKVFNEHLKRVSI